ncbi:MAG: HIT family protein [Pseudomonadota bacterium]
MGTFKLDGKLQADSRPISVLGLCQLRLMNDRRFPWVLLVPQRPDMEEIFQLSPLDQTLLTFEAVETAKALKQVTKCTKINVAALGNQVRQLHVHVIARHQDDPAWPGPVWGVGKAEAYDTNSANTLIEAIVKEL